MTDISSLRPHADPQLTPVAPFSPAPSSLLPNGHASVDPSLDDEESSTIKCICGFPDDDGHTVLCEKCNTWQHIACYYESLAVPDIHECADCCPRPVDVKGATERQRQRIRELASIGDRRVKKPASKSHKKKVKEPSSTPATGAVALTPGGGAGAGSLPNGWSADKSDSHYSDRKSGSPKDHQPPAKRPKTSHKSSNSVSAIGLHGAGPVLAPTSGNRKRAPSAATNGHSPTKSPTSPAANGYAADYFSPEFLQLYRHSEYQEMRENSYSDISLTKDLTEWLEDPEALAEVTDGLKPQEVFLRVPTSIEALEKSAPLIMKQVDSDRSIVSNGLYPVWHWLTVETHVPEGSYLGELTGQVCRKRDYCSAPSSRWQTLRHPEPFVFFPPHLPLAIDARKGSTVMRFARRSCDPNMIMRIFITDNIYHFCFVSTRDIEADQELTLPWDVDPDIRRLLGTVLNNGNIHKEGIRGVEQVSQWVAGVLSNFGGCACKRARGDCLLERADRRNGSHLPDSVMHPSKMAKARKLKKQQQHHHHHHHQQISPLSTGHATNSRAGSEALKAGDHDDDMADTRSVSGSTRSKPGSRDITPMTHVSTDALMGFTGVELSDREKRKLMQSERLFEQLEYDEQHGHRRKKRNSAGSTLNTPSASTSKQLGYPDAVMSSISAKTRAIINGQRVNGTHSRSGNRSMKPPQKPRPDYVDTSTQTEGDCTVGSASNPNFIRRDRVPFFRELLNRARDERLRREAQTQDRRERDSRPQTPLSGKQDGCTTPRTPESKVIPTEGSASEQTASEPVKTEQQDTEMMDVGASTDSPPGDFRKPDAPSIKSSPTTTSPVNGAPSTTENSAQTSHPPAHPPAPPWPSTSPTTSTAATESPVSVPSLKPSNLRVDLPPAPDFSQISSAATQTTPGSTTSGPLTGQTIAQSPSTVTAQSPSALSASQGPIFSPSVTSAVAPSPMAKRLSLSDYMARQKARKQEAQAQAQASHGSIAEGAEGSSHDHASDANSVAGNDAPSKDVEMKDAGSSDAMDLEPSAAAVAVKDE